MPARILDPSKQYSEEELERLSREEEEVASAAFKLRLALPGVFGEQLSVKVQSLRTKLEGSCALPMSARPWRRPAATVGRNPRFT